MVILFCNFQTQQRALSRIGCSISHKKSVRLRDFSFFLSSTFIYEPLLIKKILWMLTLWRRNFFINEDWPHLRSYKVILKFQNHLFLRYIFFCLCPIFYDLFKNVIKFFVKWSMTSKVIQGHIRPLLFIITLAHSIMDRCWWKYIWMLISRRHNFFIKLYMAWIFTFMLWKNL